MRLFSEKIYIFFQFQNFGKKCRPECRNCTLLDQMNFLRKFLWNFMGLYFISDVEWKFLRFLTNSFVRFVRNEFYASRGTFFGENTFFRKFLFSNIFSKLNWIISDYWQKFLPKVSKVALDVYRGTFGGKILYLKKIVPLSSFEFLTKKIRILKKSSLAGCNFIQFAFYVSRGTFSEIFLKN